MTLEIISFLEKPVRKAALDINEIILGLRLIVVSIFIMIPFFVLIYYKRSEFIINKIFFFFLLKNKDL